MQTTISFNASNWQCHFSKEQHQDAQDLENGNVLVFPQLKFALTGSEVSLLNPKYLAPKAKNISYNPKTAKLSGAVGASEELHLLEVMVKRYAAQCLELMNNLFPHYKTALIAGRTSYRPATVSTRKISPRKDDRLLHVDAFPATPNLGMRILRVFSNINPHGEARRWHLGEPFQKVAETFIPIIRKPWPGKHSLIRALRMTKAKRSLYDHYMLNIHDAMKENAAYQARAVTQKVDFMPGTTWIVATDQVSHAALSGQFMMEQTFYLPVEAMQSPEHSPLRVLESLLQKRLAK